MAITYALEIDVENHGMPEMTCPVCGQDALEYYDTDAQDSVFGIIRMKWECKDCGATGQDNFDLAIDSREWDD